MADNPIPSTDLPGVPDCMQRLWTPHRMAYIDAHGHRLDGEPACPFCASPTRPDPDALIVARGRTSFVVLNLFPYNPGHLLVCPYRHVAYYTDLSEEEAQEVGTLTRSAMHTLRRVSSPDGFNIGINQGSAAGAGIAEHFHQHVVPRWSGDANFFPIIAQTKALPQLLSQTRDLIAEQWGDT